VGAAVRPLLSDSGGTDITSTALPALPRLVIVFALVCVATSAVWLKLQSPTAGIDDANIFFVYAQNLSEGRGFVFNPEGERVEGFTSLAWVLVCAAAYWAAGSPEALLLLINVLLLTTTIGVCLTTWTFRRNAGSTALSLPWASAFVALLLSDYSHVTWTTIALMETALWTALLTMAAILVLDEAIDRVHVYGFAAVTALMVATRPEALVWGLVMMVLFYGTRHSLHGHVSALRSALPAFGAYVLASGLLTAFRLWYFGYPLPNTYYAKMSPSLTYRLWEGAGYLWAYLMSGLVAFASALATAFTVIAVTKAKLRDTRTAALGVMAAIGLALPVYMGGDHFGGYRFYQPVFPILLLTLLNCLRFVLPTYTETAPARTRRRGIQFAGVALTALFLFARFVEWRNFDRSTDLRREFEIAEIGRDRGLDAEALFAGLRSRPSIGTITVGGLKHAYSGDVIDLMGLNNTRMAHNKGARVGIRSHAAFEKATFYELNPTLVLPLVQYSDLAVQATKIWFVDVALKGLVNDGPFRSRYALAEVRRTTPDGRVAVAGWYDRDFLSRIARLKEFEVQEAQTLPE
jgi:arabinofuranosyltransferase